MLRGPCYVDAIVVDGTIIDLVLGWVKGQLTPPYYPIGRRLNVSDAMLRRPTALERRSSML